jgi:hypothetical protein
LELGGYQSAANDFSIDATSGECFLTLIVLGWVFLVHMVSIPIRTLTDSDMIGNCARIIIVNHVSIICDQSNDEFMRIR